MVRNLFYFIYPLNPEMWRWNVRRIQAYWSVFNGKRLVMVALDERTESAEAVLSAFEGHDARFEVVKNDPGLFEAPFFTSALATLRSSRADECVFHAHTKGQSHEGPMLENVRRWTDAMYVLNLESPELVDEVMRSHPTAGCFRQVMQHGGAPWHFSGGFFWMRHDALFSREWDCPLADKYAVEGYPGRLFKQEEGFALTPHWRHEDLYHNPPNEELYRKWLADLTSKMLAEPEAPGP